MSANNQPAIENEASSFSHPKPTEDLSREILCRIIQQMETTNKKDSDDLEFFRFFVVTMIAISVFGASTFAVILGEMTDPADIWESPIFSLKTVRLFLAVSWLSFAMSIALAGYSGSVLALMRQKKKGDLDEATIKKWTPAGLVVSVALHLLIVTGFFFISLSLVAYVGPFGWVIVSVSGIMYIVVFCLIGAQYSLM
ncbi:uncharacterized protein FIESC28_05384 [Fusarium coffeatum]|uniref:Uncharacterized protein n=1 Tax=Fusarium coffeatum TaxID=231269 RepID=A0A366RUV5_9HYPO|nr:uncharacterized protein FIESC28_05384 [Fusarium coffeatum]RBR20105.1 hypothetical protein FIESC28_05384 [Fusarium coffeatum]